LLYKAGYSQKVTLKRYY